MRKKLGGAHARSARFSDYEVLSILPGPTTEAFIRGVPAVGCNARLGRPTKTVVPAFFPRPLGGAFGFAPDQ